MAKVYFRYGAMGSGKTADLLRVAYNYGAKDMGVVIVKPKVDTKGDNEVVSRMGFRRKVDIVLGAGDDVHEELAGYIDVAKCVLIDEAQFLTRGQVDALYEVAKVHDVPVICYGLRCDFAMEGFPGATRLLQVADSIEEAKTVCMCGRKATQNARFVDGAFTTVGEQVCIDGARGVTYEAVCGECYLKMRRRESGEK